MMSNKKETAMTLLFQEFRALSEATRKAGDEQSANLIDFLCEREDVAKQMEKEQIEDAYDRKVINGKQNWFIGDGKKYYNIHYNSDSKQ
jgi:hypothetical protein